MTVPVAPTWRETYDTEVAAAPEGPEEIRMSVLIRVEKLAVGGHHLSREHVVDGEGVLADRKKF